MAKSSSQRAATIDFDRASPEQTIQVFGRDSKCATGGLRPLAARRFDSREAAGGGTAVSDGVRGSVSGFPVVSPAEAKGAKTRPRSPCRWRASRKVDSSVRQIRNPRQEIDPAQQVIDALLRQTGVSARCAATKQSSVACGLCRTAGFAVHDPGGAPLRVCVRRASILRDDRSRSGRARARSGPRSSWPLASLLRFQKRSDKQKSLKS